MRLMAFVAASSLSVAALVQGASASTITETVSFTATDLDGAGLKAPVDPVTGSFTVTLDPTQNYSFDAADIVTNDLNIPVANGVEFEYDAKYKDLWIGGDLGGPRSIAEGTNDFILTVNLNPSLQGNESFVFAQAGLSGYWVAFRTNNLSVTYDPPLAATPIPGSVLMLLTSLGVLGGIALFGGRKVQPNAARLAA